MAALDDVERELENIRVALRQAADDRSSSRFEELFSTLYTLWVGRGRSSEGASWAAELSARPDLDPARPHRRARLRRVGDEPDQPRGRAGAGREAIALAASTGAAPPLIATCTMGLGAMMQGETDEAIATCDRVDRAVG